MTIVIDWERYTHSQWDPTQGRQVDTNTTRGRLEVLMGDMR